MSIGKTGHVLVRTSHSRGQLKGQRFQSSKSAMSGGLRLVINDRAPAPAVAAGSTRPPRSNQISSGIKTPRNLAFPGRFSSED
jgi:hypothetical protein